MDPNSTLAEIRSLLSKSDDLEALSELPDLIEGLDNWLSRGGFLPREWENNKTNSIWDQEDLDLALQQIRKLLRGECDPAQIKVLGEKWEELDSWLSSGDYIPSAWEMVD